MDKLFKLCNLHALSPSFFELSTALAFLRFRDEQCEYVVLEVGLGGQLDATNVIQKPAVSVITSIQQDHCKALGSTVQAISHIKGGIIKPNCPILIGPGCNTAVFQVLASKANAPLHQVNNVLDDGELSVTSRYLDCFSSSTTFLEDEDVPPVGSGTGTGDMLFNTDDVNKDISCAVLKLLFPSTTKAHQRISCNLTRGLQVRPPCRFEEFFSPSLDNLAVMRREEDRCGNVTSNTSVRVILDIAHNVAAIRALALKLRSIFVDHKFRYVFSYCCNGVLIGVSFH